MEPGVASNVAGLAELFDDFREVRHVRLEHAEAEHARLHQLTDHITALIHQWRTSASSLHAKQLAAALEQLTLLLNDRMARREETILWPRTASLAS